MVKLFEDERLDYLFAKGSRQIIQSPSVFSFSLDAVLLADFATVPTRRGEILDLCTGNGVIPLLLSARTKAQMIGVEIQEKLAQMAVRSVAHNELTEQIEIIHGDLNEMQPVLGHSRFETVTCNPPYFITPSTTEQNKNDYFTIARHEVCCTLEEVVRACKFHVKPGGKVAMVHRPDRLVDLLTLFRAYNLEPKRLRFVYPKQGKEANIVLVEAIRDGKVGLTLLPPLYIYEQDNTHTKEAEAIIHGRS